MKFEVYNAKRNELLDACNGLINDGKVDEANAKMEEVKALDAQYDAEAKAEADMAALAGQARKVNVSNLPGRQVQGTVAETANQTMTADEAFRSETYMTAWAKTLQNRALSTDEARVFEMVNAEGSGSAPAYTHDTGNTAVLIPETVAAGIWKEIGEKYPFYADTMKTYIKGKAVMIRSIESSEAKWYVESVKTEDGKELFKKTELNGCELARAITVSWKLREMAIADFIPYIISSMAEQMGKGLAYGSMSGAGVREGHAPEPLGIQTALAKEENTPQIVQYDASKGITYKDLVSARSKVKSGYTPAIYCDSNTMWNQLANLVDANGRPILMADATAQGGVYRVLGCVVKEDDSVGAGKVLFSDAKQYQININKEVSMSSETHVKERVDDFCAYAIVDGAPITLKAHALLQPGE